MKIKAGNASIDSHGHTHFLIDDEVSELLEKKLGAKQGKNRTTNELARIKNP